MTDTPVPDMTGFYLVNVSQGRVTGPMSRAECKDSLDLDRAEWATRPASMGKVRASKMCEVTVVWGPRSDEDRQQQTVISLVQESTSKVRSPQAVIAEFPPNEYTYVPAVPNGLGRYVKAEANGHYGIFGLQACLEVASELIIRYERAQRPGKHAK